MTVFSFTLEIIDTVLKRLIKYHTFSTCTVVAYYNHKKETH